MTMPHLHNCSHQDEGWCLDCVKELWEEKESMRDYLMPICEAGVYRLTRKEFAKFPDIFVASSVEKAISVFRELYKKEPHLVEKIANTYRDVERDAFFATVIERQDEN